MEKPKIFDKDSITYLMRTCDNMSKQIRIEVTNLDNNRILENNHNYWTIVDRKVDYRSV